MDRPGKYAAMDTFGIEHWINASNVILATLENSAMFLVYNLPMAVKTKLMNSSKSRFLSTVTAKSFSDPALEAHGMTWKTTKPSRETCKFCAVENEHVTETELSWTLIYSIASISVAAAILFFVYIWTFIKRDHCVSLQT
ncbi:uncharacterized protein LOC134247544 [Saccostrea cucullata]|uniref:uncharacterized protein LOC134247544 n=1 Tax=Saccostrea cuccullata TaxID=36930 RepID=UPI002ED53824